MTFARFYPNIPASADAPKNDQPQMQINNASINSLIAIDHIGFSTTNGGYHTVVHSVDNVTDPATVGTGVGMLYTKVVTLNSLTDTQLFYLTAGGGLNQLTGSAPQTNGYAFLAGIIINWGTVTLTVGTTTQTTVNLTSPNLSFPNNMFNVQVALIPNNTSQNSSNNTVSATIMSKSQFIITFAGTSAGNFPSAYWFAIGN